MIVSENDRRGSREEAVYIVRLAEAPVVAYDCGVAGYEATRPAKGAKIDARSSAVVRCGGYIYSHNGYAARMTKAAAAKAEAQPGVFSVEKTQEVEMDTATTPAFLGLTKPAAEGGLWAKGIKGENVVIGIIDSGIWPESKRFSDRDAQGLFAADAGDFVATSAGNSGPTATTHISPWLAAVAAGTHNRNGVGSVTLGNGATYTGASLRPGVGPAPFVYAGDVKKGDTAAGDAQLCFPNTLDPAKVTGKIVLCDRGISARVEKSQVVRDAGGVGMILRNLAPSSLNADLHSIPTVHVDEVVGAAIKTYIDTAGAGATATISQATVVLNSPAPDVAAFSSRGPSLAGGGDILKPDFMLPGVDILAAISRARASAAHRARASRRSMRAT